ncbi:MAG: hypothetical protein GY792_21870 [Gammaproteobacteria bacterium]|nr:hypothetical protein [Gammaproteobacteria bacterium]
MNSGNSPHYVIKRVSREWDWIMHATGDRYGRTTTLWQHGILDRLPEEIEHTVLACAVDGAGRAILMRDVTETLLPDGEQPISEKDHELILDAMAALHAAFWEDPILQHPALNVCTPEQIFSWTSPERARQVLAVCPHEVLEWVIGGWDLLPEYVEADVAELLRSLARDPSPLCTALARFPRTLVHSDMRAANLGVIHDESPRLILLDWMLAAATVPTLDLARYLLEYQFPSSKEATIDFYKQRLAQRLGDRFDESWWQPLLELGLLASFLQIACFKAWFGTHHEDEECRIQQLAVFPWCSEYARAWAKWLS